MNAPDGSKKALRARTLAALREITPEQRTAAGREVCRSLQSIDAVGRARTILAFAPLRSEPDIGPLLESMRQGEQTVLLPRMRSDSDLMEAAPLTEPLETLERDQMGVRSPRSAEVVPLEQIDLVFVPGVAFDPWGQRLGRGGGHYDRLLSRVSQAHLVGVCFDLAMCEKIPVEAHDRRVDRVVTERRTINCADQSPS